MEYLSGLNPLDSGVENPLDSACKINKQSALPKKNFRKKLCHALTAQKYLKKEARLLAAMEVDMSCFCNVSPYKILKSKQKRNYNTISRFFILNRIIFSHFVWLSLLDDPNLPPKLLLHDER